MPADLKKKNPEDMWAEIQPIYEMWYRVKFRKKPPADKIEWLYSEYLKRIGANQNYFYTPLSRS